MTTLNTIPTARVPQNVTPPAKAPQGAKPTKGPGALGQDCCTFSNSCIPAPEGTPDGKPSGQAVDEPQVMGGRATGIVQKFRLQPGESKEAGMRRITSDNKPKPLPGSKVEKVRPQPGETHEAAFRRVGARQLP